MFSNFEEIKVGDRRSLQRKITPDDVRRFVEMTGDDNPLHVDKAYAQTTSFKDVVVHGMLGASFISTVIGTKLPGPGALWLSQQMEFLLPVRLGDELTITCEVVKKNDGERLLELETLITNQNGQRVLSGSGRVKVLPRNEPKAVDTPARCMVAIVTGAAGGMGQAISTRLAADGFAVVVNYASRREEAEELVARIRGGGGRAVAVQADISTQGGSEALFQAAMGEYGGVGVLVNNASPRVNPQAFSSLAWDAVQRQLDVQVKGAFMLSRLCAADMVSRKSGRIINIASQAAEGAPDVGWLGYSLGKSGLLTLSRCMAVELGPSGVTVNAVSPGMTDTGMVGDIPEKAQRIAARQTPLRRLAEARDVASAVAWLASEDARFVTGQNLRVNGGMVM